MTLELKLATSIFRMRLIERAINDLESWTATWGDSSVPLKRKPLDDGVEFSADFPATCHIERPDGFVRFISCDEVIFVVPIEDPGDGGFTFSMAMNITTKTVAA